MSFLKKLMDFIYKFKLKVKVDFSQGFPCLVEFSQDVLWVVDFSHFMPWIVDFS